MTTSRIYIERIKFSDVEPVLLALIRLVTSKDPNDIVGPAGTGADAWVPENQHFPYMIRFENDPKEATAPALEVEITNQLDSDLDWTTFEFTSFGFGSHKVSFPAGLQSFQTSVDTTNPDGSPLRVDVDASLNLETGIVSWLFRSVDPLTGAFPFDPFAGFLPPNDESHRGEGYVSYTIRPRTDRPTGTRIDAEASIVFDTNEAILTPPIFNTLDTTSPASGLVAVPARTTKPQFLVTWQGDDEAGSGVQSYDVYVSDDGEPFTSWLSGTTETSMMYDGQLGHSYAFVTLARDNVGNQEVPPDLVDFHFTVVDVRPPVVQDTPAR